jgi:hypothetical protein
MKRTARYWITSVVLLVSCSQLNVLPPDDGGSPVTGGGTSGQAGGPGGNGGMPIAAIDAPVATAGGSGGAGGQPTDPACQPGFHQCGGGGCVDSRSPEHCGLACSPCPPVTGGTATCDGTQCGASCPAGNKLCLDRCVPEATSCDGKCPAGTNPCGGGLCVDAKSLSACGTACMPCPTPPNGVASCNGDTCDLTCNAGYHKCGTSCLSNNDPASCGSSCTPCEAPTGGKATCDGAKCGAQCPGGTKLCAGACIPTAQACNGQCPSGKHDCNGNCVSDSDVSNCGTACIPCSPPDNADATCDGKTCAFKCRSGFHDCDKQCKSNMSVDSCGSSSCTRCPSPSGATPSCNGNSCDFHCDSGRRCHDQCIGDDQPCDNLCLSGRTVCNGKCIPSGQCCTDRDCGKCQECNGGSCRDQATGQDKKKECGNLACTGGKCQTCSPGTKKCTGANQLDTCNNAGTGFTPTNCPDGCASDACVKGIAFGAKCSPGGKACAQGGNCIDSICCRSNVTSSCGTCRVCGKDGTCQSVTRGMKGPGCDTSVLACNGGAGSAGDVCLQVTGTDCEPGFDHDCLNGTCIVTDPNAFGKCN